MRIILLCLLLQGCACMAGKAPADIGPAAAGAVIHGGYFGVADIIISTAVAAGECSK